LSRTRTLTISSRRPMSRSRTVVRSKRCSDRCRDRRERAIDTQGARFVKRVVGGHSRDSCLRIESHSELAARRWQDTVRSLVRIQAECCAFTTIWLRCVSDDSGRQSQEAQRESRSRVTFVGYSQKEKNFRVFDRERRNVFRVTSNLTRPR